MKYMITLTGSNGMINKYPRNATKMLWNDIFELSMFSNDSKKKNSIEKAIKLILSFDSNVSDSLFLILLCFCVFFGTENPLLAADSKLIQLECDGHEKLFS